MRPCCLPGRNLSSHYLYRYAFIYLYIYRYIAIDISICSYIDITIAICGYINIAANSTPLLRIVKFIAVHSVHIAELCSFYRRILWAKIIGVDSVKIYIEMFYLCRWIFIAQMVAWIENPFRRTNEHNHMYI